MDEVKVQTRPALRTKPRLFVCDVDRTLLTHDHVLLPEVAAAMRSLRSAGLPLVLASARSPIGVERVHGKVGACGMTCCFNGAWVGDLPSRTALHEFRLERSLALEAMASVQSTGGSPIWFDLETCYALRPDEAIARRRTEVTGDRLVLLDALDDLPGRPFKLLATYTEQRIGDAVQALADRFAGRLSVAASGPKLVELVGPEVRKDYAAIEVARQFGLDAADVAAAGDSDNDLHMLEWAGLAITVANAKPHIQAVADLVAPSCDEGGLAQAVAWLLDELAKQET